MRCSCPGMLGNSLASLSWPLSSAFCFTFSCSTVAAGPILNIAKPLLDSPPNSTRLPRNPNIKSRKWVLHFATKIDNIELADEDKKTWETCREAFSAFNFTLEEEDEILGKAFGMIHSPYWGEERKKEVPKLELITDILDYLRSLSLSDEDMVKVLKKFPEVLGCRVEDELMANVKILEKDWSIKGKSLQNLLLRNPKVLGYNVDCKGDCMAQCTRCWVRF